MEASPSRAESSAPGGAALFGRAFRPFFLGASAHAAGAALVWTAAWLGLLPMPAWLSPTAWHAHEMLFGLVAGGIAGFLLTAAPPPACGLLGRRPLRNGRPEVSVPGGALP